MLNSVALMGRLVYDPELRTTPQGTSVCSFRLAVDRSFVRQGEQRQADFLDIVAWRQTAEFVCKYFHKGSLIAVAGSLQSRQYQDKHGNNRTAVEVVASQVSFCGGKAESKPSPASFKQEAAASSSPELTPTDEPTPFDPPPEPAPEQTGLSGGQMYSGEDLKDYAPRTSQAAALAGPAVGTPEADAMIDDGADDLPF